MKITVENFREAAAKAVKDGAAQEFLIPFQKKFGMILEN